jgi:hypothetical protein
VHRGDLLDVGRSFSGSFAKIDSSPCDGKTDITSTEWHNRSNWLRRRGSSAPYLQIS